VIIAPVRLLSGALVVMMLILLLEWAQPSGGAAAPMAALRLMHDSPKMKLAERAASRWATVILARPLFSASRRPPHVAAGARDEAAPDEARLSGILIGGFGRRAIFAPSGGGKPLVLGEGAAVNESTIRSIQPDQVVLASGIVLRPAFDKNRVPTAFTPPFQPPMPSFPNAGFGNGAGPQPNFAFPRVPQLPQLAQPEAEPAQPGAAEGQNVPAPAFRGPFIPNRRD
jgi:hypothetical protein